MSTSGILCAACGVRIATITKGGVIRFLRWRWLSGTWEIPANWRPFCLEV